VPAILDASREPDAEAWAILRYEGARLSEDTSFETVCDLAGFFGCGAAYEKTLHNDFALLDIR